MQISSDGIVAQTLSRSMLIQWNEQSQKWIDMGNDVFCSGRHGKWTVSHRYGFDPDGNIRSIDFPTEHQAMEFFINYVIDRHLRVTKNSLIF